MAKINAITIDTYQRGDSAVLPWTLQYADIDGNVHPKDLSGCRAALTISAHEFTHSIDDITPDAQGKSAALGYNNNYAVVNVDCDSPLEMHGLDPAEGKILFDLHKQMMWLEPGEYWISITIENKISKRTHTYAIGKIGIQGHPTNRLTTDAVDSYGDVRSEEDV